MNRLCSDGLTFSARILTLVVVATIAAGCKPSASEDRSSVQTPTPTPHKAPRELVSFPPDFKCDEPAVPELLKKAVQACIDQDYETFRSMWSAREEPISEKEFIRAWRASPKFALKEMRRMKTPDGEIIYAVRAQVSLDPNEVPEPERDVVLLIVNENGAWRLKKAPRKLIKLLKKKEEPDGKKASNDSTGSRPAEANTNGG